MQRIHLGLLAVLVLAAAAFLYQLAAAPKMPAAPRPSGGPEPAPSAYPTRILVPQAAEQGAAPRSPALARGRIVGGVVDADGRPLGGARVRVRPADDMGDTRWTTSAADGTYAAEVPFPGTWSVECSAPGKQSRDAVVEVPADSTGATTPPRADFVLLGRRSLRLSLQDAEGKPMGARLQADGMDPVQGGRLEILQDEDRPRSLPAQLHLARGGAAIEILEGLPVRVRWLAGTTVLAEGAAEERAAVLELRADFAQLRAEAGWVSIELDPLQRGEVRFLLAAAGGPLRPVQPKQAGRVHVLPAAPGPATLELQRDGCATLRFELEVPQGSVYALGRQDCEARCGVHGVLLDRDGAPLPAAVLAEPAGPVDAARHARRTSASVDGRYAFDGLAPGAWTLRCASGGESVRLNLPLDPEAARAGIALRGALSAPAPRSPSRRP